MSHQLLSAKFAYYNRLSPAGQERFRTRLQKFRRSKDFIGRAGLVVNDEVQILISAAAIQLTFGLSDYLINHLHTINVFPRVFYSKMYDTKFKGLTTKGGVLALSWEDFTEGYRIGNDKINLGLHELAHALHVDLEMDGNRDSRFSIFFAKWELFSLAYLQQLNDNKITFLRKYGARNMHELFAVCVEHFFEAPDEFKRGLPELYAYMVVMLNQDATNNTDDFIVHLPTAYNGSLSIDPLPVITRKDKINYFLREKGLGYAMTLTIIGLFIGIPVYMWLASVTVIDKWPMILLIVGSGSLGLLQWKYIKENIALTYPQFSMYAFAGFGICLANLLLLLNYLITIDGYTEQYQMKSFNMYNNSHYVELYGREETSGLERSFNSYIDSNYEEVPSAKRVEVSFKRGIFGLLVLDNMRFYDEKGQETGKKRN